MRRRIAQRPQLLGTAKGCDVAPRIEALPVQAEAFHARGNHRPFAFHPARLVATGDPAAIQFHQHLRWCGRGWDEWGSEGCGPLGTDAGGGRVEQVLGNLGLLLGHGGPMPGRLLPDGFGTDLRADLRLQGAGGAGKGSICSRHGSLPPEFGGHVGAVERGKEGGGGAKAMGTGGTAQALDGNLHAPETGQDDAAGSAISVAGRVLTSRAVVDLGLGVHGRQAQCLAHGLPSGVQNVWFHQVHIGAYRQVDGE